MITAEHSMSTRRLGKCTVANTASNHSLIVAMYVFLFFLRRETSWEPPAIMAYKPPPGRDEMGNILTYPANDLYNWTMFTDNKGQVFYRHKESGEVTIIPPNAYQKIPSGKSKEAILGEACQLVLSFIKEKISKHIAQKKKVKERLENPLTPEQQRKKEKLDAAAVAAGEPPDGEDGEAEEEDELDKQIPLSAYHYDIETVEMLADQLTNKAKLNVENDPMAVRMETRAFLNDSAVRTFDEGLYIGPSAYETDMALLDVGKLRNIVEDLSLIEDKLDKQMTRVRTNLKDFSFILMEKVAEQDRHKERELMLEMQKMEKERKQERKRLLIEQRKKERAEKAELDRQLKERKDASLTAEQRRVEKAESNERVFSPENIAAMTTEEAISINQAANDNNIGEGERGAVQEEVTTPPMEEAPVKVEEMERPLSTEEQRRAATAPLGDSHVVEDMQEEEEFDSESEYGGEGGDGKKLETITVASKDYGNILFGDLQLGVGEEESSPEMLAMCGKLANFAIFCGFANVRASESPTDSTTEFSLFAAGEHHHGKGLSTPLPPYRETE